MNFKNAFSGKKVLVTGAEGFIGSHLVELLQKQNAKVTSTCLYNSFNSWGWLEDIDNKNLNVITGDIRDLNYCREITSNIDIVLHLAALIAIPYSYRSPGSYIETNVKGTLNLCQAALENECKRFIHISTSEVYGTAQYVPIDEMHPLQPQSPYSASKIGADAIAMSHYHSFSLPVTIARPFNTFGPRQSARAVIPSIITQIITGKKRIHLGNLKPTRDFTYVKDTCSGILSICNNQKSIGEAINIGTNTELSINDIFNLIKRLMKSTATVQPHSERLRPENSEVFRLCCNNSKLSKMTGWKPESTFEHGLQETIDWFSKPENISKFKSDIYNV